MNDADRNLMQALGITVARKNVYSYKEFRYEWLDDAIRYAEIDTRRNGPGHDGLGRNETTGESKI